MNLPELCSRPLYPLFTDTQSVRFYWQQHASIDARTSLPGVLVGIELSHAGKEKAEEKGKKKKSDGSLFSNSWQENWTLGVEVDFVLSFDAGVPSRKRAIATKRQ